MPASHGLQNTAFVCGMENEANCLRAAGIDNPIALSGARSQRAAEISRELIACGAQSLISIGLAGGLDPRLGPGSVILADRVLSRSSQFETDPELRAQLSAALGDETRQGAIVGVDRVVATRGEKQRLYGETKGLACDMESHALAEAALAAGVPFLVLRVVSDASNRFIPQSALAAITASGRTSPGRVLFSLSLRPWEVFELLALARDARIAFAALRRVALRGAPLFSTTR